MHCSVGFVCWVFRFLLSIVGRPFSYCSFTYTNLMYSYSQSIYSLPLITFDGLLSIYFIQKQWVWFYCVGQCFAMYMYWYMYVFMIAVLRFNNLFADINEWLDWTAQRSARTSEFHLKLLRNRFFARPARYQRYRCHAIGANPFGQPLQRNEKRAAKHCEYVECTFSHW